MGMVDGIDLLHLPVIPLLRSKLMTGKQNAK